MDALRSMTVKKDKAGLRVLHLIAGGGMINAGDEHKGNALLNVCKKTGESSLQVTNPAPHLIMKICLLWFSVVCRLV